MPLAHYGVLVGKPVDRRLATHGNKHYQIRLVDDDADYRIAVNVESGDGSQVEYAVLDPFLHPITDALVELPNGFRPLRPGDPLRGLDYIRGNLAPREKFRPLPFSLPGSDNDLNDKLEALVARALASETARAYAFGASWGIASPQPGRDALFGFRPQRGIHDIHMNQGNSGKWKADNGVWQDGGLLFDFDGHWVAILLKFQTQPWHSDDRTGDPLPEPPGGPPEPPAPPAPPAPPTGGGPEVPEPELPTGTDPEGLVRIIAALVNDTASPEREVVTLLNRSPLPLDLTGWSLVDHGGRRLALNGRLERGATLQVAVRPTVQLSNKGGTLSLLDDAGLKVDGVAWTKTQVRDPGWTIVF